MSALRQSLLRVGLVAASIGVLTSPALAGGNPQAHGGTPGRPPAMLVEAKPQPVTAVTVGSPQVVYSPWGGDPLVSFYLRRVAWEAIQREAAYRQMLYQQARYQHAQYLAHVQRLRQEAWYRGEIGRQLVRQQSNQRLADVSKAAASRPGSDVPPSAEQRANAKLQLAKLLLSEGHKADAREYCEDIVATYGGTPAAQEAKSLLGQAK